MSDSECDLVLRDVVDNCLSGHDDVWHVALRLHVDVFVVLLVVVAHRQSPAAVAHRIVRPPSSTPASVAVIRAGGRPVAAVTGTAARMTATEAGVDDGGRTMR